MRATALCGLHPCPGLDGDALAHNTKLSWIGDLASKPFRGGSRMMYQEAGNGGNKMKSTIPKRASTRIDVSYDAVLITSDDHEFAVIVKDLSADGFRIQIDEEVRVGEKVFLRTRRDGDIPAQIAWTLGSEAGGMFLAKSRIE